MSIVPERRGRGEVSDPWGDFCENIVKILSLFFKVMFPVLGRIFATIFATTNVNFRETQTVKLSTNSIERLQ